MDAQTNFRRRPILHRVTFLGIICVLGIAAFSLYYRVHEHDRRILEDSLGYIDFSPERTIGYPIFLAIARLFDRDFALVFPVQLALFIGSSAALSVYVARLLDSYGGGLILFALLLANKPMIALSATVMSDPLSSSLLALFAAASIHYLSSPTVRSSLVKTLFVALSVMVRPINIVFVLADVLIISCADNLRWIQRLKYIGVAILISFVATQASPLYHKLYRGTSATSPLPGGLFVKAALYAPVDQEAYSSCINETSYSSVMAGKEYIFAAPKVFQPILLGKMSDLIWYKIAIPSLIADGRSVSESFLCYDIKAMKNYWLEILTTDFLDYIKLAAYRPRLVSADAGAYIAYITERSPLDYVLERSSPAVRELINSQASLRADFYPEEELSGAPRFGASLMIGLSNLASVVALLLIWFIRPIEARRLLLVSIAFGISTNLALAITSVLEFPVSRFVMVYLPLELTALICTVWAIAIDMRNRYPLCFNWKAVRSARRNFQA